MMQGHEMKMPRDGGGRQGTEDKFYSQQRPEDLILPLVLASWRCRNEKTQKRGCSLSMPAEKRCRTGLAAARTKREPIVTEKVTLPLLECAGRERRQ